MSLVVRLFEALGKSCGLFFGQLANIFQADVEFGALDSVVNSDVLGFSRTGGDEDGDCGGSSDGDKGKLHGSEEESSSDERTW